MNLIRCPSCLGAKKVQPLGMIEKECDPCKGIGFVEEPITVIESIGNKPIEERAKRRERIPISKEEKE